MKSASTYQVWLTDEKKYYKYKNGITAKLHGLKAARKRAKLLRAEGHTVTVRAFDDAGKRVMMFRRGKNRKNGLGEMVVGLANIGKAAKTVQAAPKLTRANKLLNDLNDHVRVLSGKVTRLEGLVGPENGFEGAVRAAVGDRLALVENAVERLVGDGFEGIERDALRYRLDKIEKILGKVDDVEVMSNTLNALLTRVGVGVGTAGAFWDMNQPVKPKTYAMYLNVWRLHNLAEFRVSAYFTKEEAMRDYPERVFAVKGMEVQIPK